MTVLFGVKENAISKKLLFVRFIRKIGSNKSFLLLNISRKGIENEKIEEDITVREDLISSFRYEQQNDTQTVHLIYNNL